MHKENHVDSYNLGYTVWTPRGMEMDMAVTCRCPCSGRQLASHTTRVAPRSASAETTRGRDGSIGLERSMAPKAEEKGMTAWSKGSPSSRSSPVRACLILAPLIRRSGKEAAARSCSRDGRAVALCAPSETPRLAEAKAVKSQPSEMASKSCLSCAEVRQSEPTRKADAAAVQSVATAAAVKGGPNLRCEKAMPAIPRVTVAMAGLISSWYRVSWMASVASAARTASETWKGVDCARRAVFAAPALDPARSEDTLPIRGTREPGSASKVPSRNARTSDAGAFIRAVWWYTSPYRAALSRSVAARRRQRRPRGMGSEPRMATWPRLARDRIRHLLSSCPTTNTTSWAERARTEPVRMPSRASVPAQMAAEAARFRPARCRAAYAALSASIATMLIASAQRTADTSPRATTSDQRASWAVASAVDKHSHTCLIMIPGIVQSPA
mmetsp:Transcript_24344/g.73139  ORF Transcript_24344/g.73139 Transcript_24344/m.73139 type:complete len:441 (+) Transcript_24344:107-1429(+)